MAKNMTEKKQKRTPIKNGNPSEPRLTGTGVDTPLLYGRQEAAEALGVSVTTLDRMHRERTGPKRIPIGRRILYPRESLEFWVLEQPEG
jgi:predicted DNA-binding transcriptional regulator AlpA